MQNKEDKLEIVNKYPLDQIYRVICSLDLEMQINLFSNFNMNELWSLMNDEKFFKCNINKLEKTANFYYDIFNAVNSLKHKLDDSKSGYIEYTDEQIKEMCIGEYNAMPEEHQLDMLAKLDLVKSKDVLIQKNDVINIDTIIELYNLLSDADKAKLGSCISWKEDPDTSKQKGSYAINRFWNLQHHDNSYSYPNTKKKGKYYEF